MPPSPPDLLNITAAPNNGTYGALHSFLNNSVTQTLPPPTTPGGSPGIDDTCPFPEDYEVFLSRSVCEDCVCSDGCVVNHTSILASNLKSFNGTAQEGEGSRREVGKGRGKRDL